jgi:hypothetical protein
MIMESMSLLQFWQMGIVLRVVNKKKRDVFVSRYVSLLTYLLRRAQSCLRS